MAIQSNEKTRTRVETLLDSLDGVHRSGARWTALCPAHADKNPSLSIDVRDDRILVHCHAGCSQEAVLAVLGIEPRELFLDPGNSERRIVAEYQYKDENGSLLFEVVRFEPKDFRQRRPDGKGGWIWNLNGTRRVLYRLPEVLAASSVLVVEGEKDCDTARTLDLVATCNPGGAGKWRDEFSESLQGKNICVIADADEPGRKHAQQVAESLHLRAESVKVLELPGAKDLSEWVERGGTSEALLELIKSTAEWKPSTPIARQQGTQEIVDGSALLDAIQKFIRRFVSLSLPQARVAAVWVVHTYAFGAADSTPYLAINSAEKQSGKTRLLEVFETLVANPWFTGRVTAAVLTRKIDADRPALLLDESDAAFGGEKEYAEALRGLLNVGHRRGGKASCCVGQGANIGFKDFSTFCPKAIAGIGKLPDTVTDRAIPIRLKRAVQSENVERFRRRDVETETAQLRVQIEAWCGAIVPTLRDARPQLPEELTDRQQDGCEPLLAIADAAAGVWPEALRRSLVALCAEAQAADTSIGVQLLTDIRQIFETRGVDRLASPELAAELCEIETSPWAEWSHGKPLTPGKLARLLSPYEIKPHTLRIVDKTAKGYWRSDFSDAFGRYLPARTPVSPSKNVTPDTSFIFNELESKQNVTESRHVTVQKPNNPCEIKRVSDVTLSSPTTGEKRVIEVEI